MRSNVDRNVSHMLHTFCNLTMCHRNNLGALHVVNNWELNWQELVLKSIARTSSRYTSVGVSLYTCPESIASSIIGRKHVCYDYILCHRAPTVHGFLQLCFTSYHSDHIWWEDTSSVFVDWLKAVSCDIGYYANNGFREEDFFARCWYLR